MTPSLKRRGLRLGVAPAAVLALLAFSLVTPIAAAPPRQATDTETPTPTNTAPPSNTPVPTSTSTNTPVTPVYTRPLIVLDSYSPGGYSVARGQEFTLSFRLRNAGSLKARNIVATFSSGDFLMRQTGGVVPGGVIDAGASTGYSQPMTASPALTDGSIGSISLSVSYTDDIGGSYSEAFTLSIPIGSAPRTPAPFASRTPTPGYRPQLLVQGYLTEPEVLSPGTRFTLRMTIVNVGETPARRITMILGGGTSSGPGQGTPGADTTGGLSGSGGDFSNFAPVGSSNVQFLGDLPAGTALTASQEMIVNGTTAAGAYALRISLIYTDPRGNSLTDDQVISVLVFSEPILEISFYRAPDPLFAGQTGTLPIQLVNIGRNSAVLGNMEITAENAEMSNSVALVGWLDPGNFYPLDALITPFQAGALEVTVAVHYLDDFNQSRTFTRTLNVEVMEGEGGGGGGGEFSEGEIPIEPAIPVTETFWQKAWRAVLGLLGLDSAPSQPQGEPGTIEEITPQEGPPILLPPSKG
jgi:hypothetical protein